MRRATGRPIILAFHGGYHGESTATATLGAEINAISAGERALVPGFAHVPYPEPVPLAVPRPATGRERRRRRRLHPRRGPLPRDRSRPRRRRRDRAGARLGRLHRSPGDLLDRADRPLPGARLAPVRRRGEDRIGPERDDVRRRALGRRARPDLHGQGTRRRGDADRRPARDRPRPRRGRRHLDRQHLVVAPRLRRRRTGDPRCLRARGRPRQRRRARARRHRGPR